MKNLDRYNTRLGLRVNRVMRKLVNRRNRKRLENRDFSLLCNNCNGGVLSHDLGLQFRSPTVNLFFYGDHFFRFCEDFEHYIAQELTLCENPIHKPDTEYPICNLGDLELHFLHYASFEEAKQKWDARTARLNRENLFVMWSFFDGTDEQTLARFEALPFRNKVAFTEKEFPAYSSAACIPGYEDGLGVLTLFDGFTGKRKIDRFDYVAWFKPGEIGVWKPAGGRVAPRCRWQMKRSISVCSGLRKTSLRRQAKFSQGTANGQVRPYGERWGFLGSGDNPPGSPMGEPPPFTQGGLWAGG